jgi:hypothetical protein
MMSKKASMELGINTVVVLVIAMVIIAGGIAFIRGFFKLGTEKLGGAFNVGDFGVQPTSVEPLVLVDGAPSIKAGKTESFKVGFYNRANTDVDGVEIQFSECVSTVSNPNECGGNIKPLIKSLSQKVLPGDSAGFENFLTAKCDVGGVGVKNLAAGDYICTIIATDGTNTYERKQITFTVEP